MIGKVMCCVPKASSGWHRARKLPGNGRRLEVLCAMAPPEFGGQMRLASIGRRTSSSVHSLRQSLLAITVTGARRSCSSVRILSRRTHAKLWIIVFSVMRKCRWVKKPGGSLKIRFPNGSLVILKNRALMATVFEAYAGCR